MTLPIDSYIFVVGNTGMDLTSTTVNWPRSSSLQKDNANRMVSEAST